jgi:SAM-dependent methyltransferase
MPTMYEIYERHAKRYHELVKAEDYKNNLTKLLYKEARWENSLVLEAGTGTGRVTSIYIKEADHAICCDRSQHMLDHAKAYLKAFQQKIEYFVAENLNLPDLSRKVDIFIEGWSFGHTASEGESEIDIRTITRRLVENATKNVENGGILVLIESLGTNMDCPEPPTDKLALFYEELEHRHGFEKSIVRTDYRFQSNEEAVRVMGFFFGNDFIPNIRSRNSGTIPEWTGVWIKRRTPEKKKA